MSTSCSPTDHLLSLSQPSPGSAGEPPEADSTDVSDRSNQKTGQRLTQKTVGVSSVELQGERFSCVVLQNSQSWDTEFVSHVKQIAFKSIFIVDPCLNNHRSVY